MRYRAFCAATIVGLVTLTIQGVLAQGPAKAPLSYQAYNGWKAITAPQISRDGKWLAYTLTPEEGAAELVVRSTGGATEYRRIRGSGPVITADSKFVLFTVRAVRSGGASARPDSGPAPSPEDAEDQEEAADAASRAADSFGLLDLATGKIAITPRIARFKVAGENGRYAALLRAAPEKPAAPAAPAGAKPDAKPATKPDAAKSTKRPEIGTELILLDLAIGEKVTIPEVTDFEWNRTGTRLIYTVVSADDSKSGVFLRELPAGATTALIRGKGDYRSLAFNEGGDRAAFIADHSSKKQTPDAYSLFVWTAGETEASVAATDTGAGVPDGMVVSDSSEVRFSKDGALLYFGFTPKYLKALANVNPAIKKDVWTYRDAYLQSEQKVRAPRDLKKTYRAVYRFADRRFSTLASLEVPETETAEGGAYALGSTDAPYRIERSWDADYSDYYVIDMATGTRWKMLTKARFGAHLSPSGKYAIYYSPERRAWLALRLADRKLLNVTEKAHARWTDEETDMPAVHSPYGIAGWTADDSSVLLYDRYDIWQFDLKTLEARCITAGAGRASRTVYRYLKLDPEERFVPTSSPLMLSLFDQSTKDSGIARVAQIGAYSVGKPAKPEVLLKLDRMVTGIQKARKGDIYLFARERFDEFPDLWTADGSFKNAVKLTDANTQQAKYLWGREELMHFRSADGVALDAVVIKPENFDPTKKYPLMINIYERMSDRLHAYRRPAPGTSICISRYVSNGYIVLMPDIRYKTGHPGQSALNCVIPAAQKLIDEGIVDPKRIGIQGHSWGGYEITYMITRTDFFRCVEGGAAVSDMVSAYGGIRWGTGVSREGQYEHGQSRIGAAPWERPDLYMENSAIFHVDKIHTPYLSIGNDADGAVPWYQGLEFLTAMRRLGKEAYLFNYNGEDHNLRGRPNMKDWTVYMDEYFDHFLLDAPKPDWMENGIPYLDRAKRDVKALYGPAVAP